MPKDSNILRYFSIAMTGARHHDRPIQSAFLYHLNEDAPWRPRPPSVVSHMLHVLFYSGSLSHKDLEWYLRSVAPTYVQQEEAFVDPSRDEHELTVCSRPKLVSGRIVYEAPWACKVAKTASVAFPLYPTPTMLWPASTPPCFGNFFGNFLTIFLETFPKKN